MNFFAVDALLLLVLMFSLVRRPGVCLACGAAVATLFAVVTSRLPLDRAADWVITVVGLGAWAAGLGVVRLMLTRSVSLRVLRGLAAGSGSTFDGDLRSRLIELRRWRLVRCTGGVNALTGRGRAVALMVAACHSIACITT